MVNHRRPGIYDYWVAPGGGAAGLEGLPATAARETLEETGLVVEVDRLAYVEEMASPECRQIKFWYLARVVGGAIRQPSAQARAEHIIDVQFLTRNQLRERQIFPVVLSKDFWSHLENGLAVPQYLGVREVVTNEFAV